MGRSQELRRKVRDEVCDYATEYPESLDAHLTAAAVDWLLLGREGLSPEEQLSLVCQADKFVGRLVATNTSSVSLLSARASTTELVKIVTARVNHPASVETYLSRYAADFEAWAEQLREPPTLRDLNT